ncbi:MAG TPA: PQQ-binding-like beta-propeller repeat protein, partial [Candidatus Thermoplasmatota archaeon]|nr:PQQ-binding-like beta-propeller repeat protein [Candidatus Thermoplasmatota archaeon]
PPPAAGSSAWNRTAAAPRLALATGASAADPSRVLAFSIDAAGLVEAVRADGALAWSAETGFAPPSVASRYEDRAFAFVATLGGGPSAIASPPVRALYVGSGGAFARLDPSTGAEAWRLERGPSGTPYLVGLVAADRVGADAFEGVLAAWSDGHVTAHEATTGATLWWQAAEAGVASAFAEPRIRLLGYAADPAPPAPPAAPRDRVVIVGVDGAVAAWDAADGAPAWTVAKPAGEMARVTAAHAARDVARGELVALATDRGHLRVVRGATGGVDHDLRLDDLLHEASPAQACAAPPRQYQLSPQVRDACGRASPASSARALHWWTPSSDGMPRAPGSSKLALAAVIESWTGERSLVNLTGAVGGGGLAWSVPLAPTVNATAMAHALARDALSGAGDAVILVATADGRVIAVRPHEVETAPVPAPSWERQVSALPQGRSVYQIRVPNTAFFGAHLVVASLEWTSATGARHVARLASTFDVVTIAGDEGVNAYNVELRAWLPEWR